MSLIPWLLYLDAVLTGSGLGTAWSRFLCWGGKKRMVLIDPPSAARWTQFAALGGGVGGLFLLKTTKKQMGAGILEPGTCGYAQHAYSLSRQLTLS